MEDRKRAAAAYDERIYRERKSKLYGTARISLSCLRFQVESSPASLARGKKDVEKLVRTFRKEDCYRLADDEHHVLALISPSQIEAALRQSNISLQDLCSKELPPKLVIDPSHPLRCLHGKRRLQAAGEVLQPGDDWWAVDLYADGTEAKPLNPASNADINY